MSRVFPMMFRLELTGRELAILGTVLRRCRGWDDPRELQRFVNICAEHVRGGFTEDEMERLHEHLASAEIDAKSC